MSNANKCIIEEKNLCSQVIAFLPPFPLQGDDALDGKSTHDETKL
jgi:hypothetical protein